jgi:small subunit ribosomal protein S20
MANHKSAEKRIRSNDSKRVRNRYQAKTTRNLLKELPLYQGQEHSSYLLCFQG